MFPALELFEVEEEQEIEEFDPRKETGSDKHDLPAELYIERRMHLAEMASQWSDVDLFAFKMDGGLLN